MARHPYRFVCGVTAAFLILAVSGPTGLASAQMPSAEVETGEPTPGAEPARPAAVRLDPVIVTASRLEESLSQTPSAVTVITEAEIVQRQTTDLFEQLREVPGFTLVQSGSRGGVTSLFTRGGESDHNLILVDGVKVNRGGGYFDFGDVSTLGVGRVEVVRGPQSALYGSDAMSSVIQLLTPRGQGPPRATLGFRAGNPGTFEERVGVSGGTALYGYNLAVGRIDSEGIVPINNDYGSTTVASRFDLDLGDDLHLMTTVRYIDSRFRFPTSSGDLIDGPNGNLDPRAYTENRRLILGPRAVYQAAPWWRQTLQLGLLSDWYTYRDPRDEGIDSASYVSRTRESRLSADYTSDFFLPRMLDVRPTFTLGGYVESEHIDQKTLFVSDFGSSPGRLDASRNAQAFYSQLRLEWREMLFVTSGFRLDDAFTYGTHVNPRAAAAFVVPGLHTKLRGGYSEGLKAPSFSENFSNSAFSRGDPNLEPEESTSWEIGLDQPLRLAGLGAEANLTWFSTRHRNLIAYTFASAPAPTFLNVQRTRSRGLEVGGRAFLPYGLTLRGSYTYLNTKVLEGPTSGAYAKGGPLIRRPRHLGSLTLNYAGDRLNVNFHLYLKGNTTDYSFASGGRLLLDGYTRADVALSYLVFEERWGIRSLTLEGGVKNLFDADYQDVPNFSSAETTFLAGFRAEF